VPSATAREAARPAAAAREAAIACCREPRSGVHHLRRHYGAPGAAVRALHRQCCYGQRGAASIEYADKSRTHLLFTALLAHAVMELVRSSFGSMEIGSMQVFSQGRLPCHLHPSPVSPPNQTIFVQYSWGGTELDACSKF